MGAKLTLAVAGAANTIVMYLAIAQNRAAGLYQASCKEPHIGPVYNTIARNEIHPTMIVFVVGTIGMTTMHDSARFRVSGNTVVDVPALHCNLPKPISDFIKALVA